MTSEEFENFLKVRKYATSWIQSIVFEASAPQIQLTNEQKGVFLTLEQAEIVARAVRKKLAVSISLRETGMISSEIEDMP